MITDELYDYLQKRYRSIEILEKRNRENETILASHYPIPVVYREGLMAETAVNTERILSLKSDIKRKLEAVMVMCK
jgi:hypothetical protein